MLCEPQAGSGCVCPAVAAAVAIRERLCTRLWLRLLFGNSYVINVRLGWAVMLDTFVLVKETKLCMQNFILP